MNNLQKAIEKMTVVFGKVTKNYLNDFAYDKDDLKEFEGQFIWIARENGTHLFTVGRSDAHIESLRINERQRYLFGAKKPRDILLDTVDCWGCCTVKNAEHMYFYDGYNLKKVTPEQGKQLFTVAARNLINTAINSGVHA